MAITEAEFLQAQAVTEAERAKGYAVAARYDCRRKRVVVRLSTGVEFFFPARLAQGLAGASAEDLSEIEITSGELGIHWPRLDADLYIPALKDGVFGSRAWMTTQGR